MLCTGDVVQVMTEDELYDREEHGEYAIYIDGLRWVSEVMGDVLGREVTVTDIFQGDNAYSDHKYRPGYYEFGIKELLPFFHLNPSMLHIDSVKVPDIDEVVWSAVAFY